MAKTLDDVMKDLGIRICPVCGNEYTEHPAISRRDNETEICPKCGQMEAIDDYVNAKLVNKEQDNKYCIFERRICRFANQQDGTFDCKAPSDSAMLCNKKN